MCRNLLLNMCLVWTVHAHSRTQLEQQVSELVASVNSSIEQHGEYKFSNKFSNMLLNMLLVWKHYKWSRDLSIIAVTF